MICPFTDTPCRHIDCEGLWDEKLQCCRFAMAINKILSDGKPDTYLTPREQEILGLIAQGYSNDKISEIVRTKPHTVRNQVSSILTKLGTKNRTGAVAIGVKHGIISLS